MRAKKWLTILTCICSGVGLLCILVFNSFSLKIGYDLALATFGSALLGFIMSVAEYLAEKRKAMEVFWQEAQKALRTLKKVKPIDITVPQELLLACFNEEENNKVTQEYGKTVSKALGMEITHTARDTLIRWMEKNEPMTVTKFDDIDAILVEIYNNRIQSERVMFASRFQNYIEISEISLAELDNAYGNLDFMFGNKTIRQDTYNRIYDRIRNICNSITNEAYHFRLYAEGKGNFIVCARKALELNAELFVSKQRNEDGHKFVCIYQKAFDEIEDALEDFRCKIYRNVQREDVEHHLVLGRMISFGDAKKGGGVSDDY